MAGTRVTVSKSEPRRLLGLSQFTRAWEDNRPEEMPNHRVADHLITFLGERDVETLGNDHPFLSLMIFPKEPGWLPLVRAGHQFLLIRRIRVRFLSSECDYPKLWLHNP